MNDELFGIILILHLPLWLAMLLFPRLSTTQKVVTAAWPFLVLAALNALLLVASLGTLVATDIGISATALQAWMSGGWGFLTVWSHILTLDLFAAVWIFRDARYWGVRPEPYLLATLLMGPVGIGLYLLQRRRRERFDPIRNLN